MLFEYHTNCWEYITSGAVKNSHFSMTHCSGDQQKYPSLFLKIDLYRLGRLKHMESTSLTVHMPTNPQKILIS